MKKYPKTTTLLLILTMCAFAMVAWANITYAKDVTTKFSWDADVQKADS